MKVIEVLQQEIKPFSDWFLKPNERTISSLYINWCFNKIGVYFDTDFTVASEVYENKKLIGKKVKTPKEGDIVFALSEGKCKSMGLFLRDGGNEVKFISSEATFNKVGELILAEVLRKYEDCVFVKPFSEEEIEEKKPKTKKK